ncbi:hypothetical protein [Vibrio parahaemolyticus]
MFYPDEYDGYSPHWWLKEQMALYFAFCFVIRLAGGLKKQCLYSLLPSRVIHLTGGLKNIVIKLCNACIRYPPHWWLKDINAVSHTQINSYPPHWWLKE